MPRHNPIPKDQRTVVGVSKDINLVLRRMEALEGKAVADIIREMIQDRVKGYPEFKRLAVLDGVEL